jgi:adenosylmethionine---8-amino-7-oxononanoate aminotransferase
MNDRTNLIARDLITLWHPCSQMKDYELLPPMHVVSASGAYLFLNDGRKVLDAISSWWCKHLGHGHPRLLQALREQTQCFEHVILANTTNEVIVQLSESLTSLMPHLGKVFYASDGSCAVEIALKMAIHARLIKGQTQKTKIMALANGYHGETMLALAVSDLGLYRKPYEHYFPEVEFITSVPYVSSSNDPLWWNAETSWDEAQKKLDRNKEILSVIILEPILQGAGGMLIYSQDFLARLGKWCQDNDVYLIADEILTGFGRTGKMLACEHAQIQPDFICLGKGLTGGVLPMSAVILSDAIYALFYDDYTSGKSFLHSHTHSGNALAAAVALECQKVIRDENILLGIKDLEVKLNHAFLEVTEKTKKLHNVRSIGGVVAADLSCNKSGRDGFSVYRKAIELGVLLRPLGQTIYWLPPLNISHKDIIYLRDKTIQAIQEALD